jgi:hypothetical protein
LNVYAIIIACVQATSTPLEKTCETIPLYNPFNNVSECLLYVDEFSSTVSLSNTDLYVTGFCTTKDINET